jgi:type I restriction enzyme M protein
MINKEKLNNLAGELWKGAIKLRGKFKAYEYQAVILPMIMIRRIECMLIQKRKEIAAQVAEANPEIVARLKVAIDKKQKAEKIEKETKEQVVKEKAILEKENAIQEEKNAELELNKKVKQREILQVSFFNKSDWTLSKILKDDATQIETHFREYLKEFSPIINEIIDEFNYRETISKMVKANRLESIIKLVADEDFSTDRLSNIEMGYVYEELLQRFTQDDAKDTGEHFTPREIIRIMVELMDINFNPKTSTQSISIYDPACGTGGMLSVTKEHITDKAKTSTEQDNVKTLVLLYGQEYLAQNFAVCKTDLLLRGDLEGGNKNNITKGNSLIPNNESSKETGDKHYGRQFDYMISNPPFGVDWSEYKEDAQKFETTRYKAGMPPSNDGALLFLLTMIEKMKPATTGGSKIAILFNGSPLSNGDCGGNESEIRRSILENDLLDCIVMLPDQMFYNTGIYTYIWILNNNKPQHKQNKVLIINARQQFEKEPKAFGNKRNRITETHRNWILKQYHNWKENENCKVFDKEDFSYHKVKVVFWQTDENDQPMWIDESFSTQLNNGNVKKKFDFYGDFEMTVNIKDTKENEYTAKFHFNGKETFEALVKKEIVKTTKSIKDLAAREFTTWLKNCGLTATYKHRHYIEDNEYIPFHEEIEPFLKREIDKPIITWDYSAKQGDKEILGYEILPNKYFFTYTPPTASDDLLNEFWDLEKEAEKILSSIKQIQ